MTENKAIENKEISKGTGRRRFRRVMKWLLGIVVLAVIAAGTVFLVSMKSATSAISSKSLGTFTVRRDDLIVTVTESGSIKARKSIEIKSEVEGQATIISLVPEGTYITEEDVKNGKVLFELDSSSLEEDLAQHEIDLAASEASYAEAKEGYEIQLKQNESDIAEDQLKVKFALMDFKKYLGETAAAAKEFKGDANQAQNPTDIAFLLNDTNSLGGAASQQFKEFVDNITLAEMRLKRAINQLDGTQKLYDANFVSKTELEGDILDVNSLNIQKERAEIALDLFKLYDFPKEAEKLLSDHYEAKLELARTLARARSRLAQDMATLKSAEARYNLQKSRLDKVKRQIDACIIKAPAEGLVTYVSSGGYRGRRERAIEEGATVYQRQGIISLPNTAEMIAEINVHESSVTKVRPGQSAKIIIDAFPDKVFHGEVLKVAPLPDPQQSWLSPDLKVYTTQVRIEGTYEFLKPGMSAKVEIFVEQLNDVIIVPVQVVANRAGKKVCYCLTPQGPRQQEVKTGAFNDTFVQIIDGLQVAEEVLLNPPRLIDQDESAGYRKARKKPPGDIPKRPTQQQQQRRGPGQNRPQNGKRNIEDSAADARIPKKP